MSPHPFSIQSLLFEPTQTDQQNLQLQLLGLLANSLIVKPSSQPATKKFECEDCGKQFNAHYNLARHLPVHSGARPFVCKVR
jgi:uncharacterized Zn-finger protein